MTLTSFHDSRSSRRAIDIDAIFPKAHLEACKSAAKSKIYCNSIPAFIGPWRAPIQGWHAPDADKHGTGKYDAGKHGSRFRSAPGTDATNPVALRAALTAAQARAALRRERQLGIGGHPSYSVDRHDQLRRALAALEGGVLEGGMLEGGAAEGQAIERGNAGLRPKRATASAGTGRPSGAMAASRHRPRKEARLLH
jgi:hypothetical protein